MAGDQALFRQTIQHQQGAVLPQKLIQINTLDLINLLHHHFRREFSLQMEGRLVTAVSVWGVILRLITIVVDQICLEGIIDWLFETNDKNQFYFPFADRNKW